MIDLAQLARDTGAAIADADQHGSAVAARNRFLGYCDHNRSTQAIIEECQRMGLGDRLAEQPAPTGRPQDVLISAISLLERNGSVAFEIGKQLRAAVNELEQALAESAALVQTTSLHEQAARSEMQKALTELATDRKERNILEAERDRLRSLVADQRIAIQGYADQRDAAKSEAMEERNHREKGESVMRELTKQRDALRQSSRSPFAMGELHGGSEGMTCDHQACQAKSWSVFLTAAEWRDVWQHRDTDAGLFINQKKLGKVLCEKHAAEVAVQSQVMGDGTMPMPDL